MAKIRGTPQVDSQAGTDGNDLFIGSRTGDEFFGRYGDDVIRGRRGDDVLQGGEGADLLFGDRGNDILSGEGGWGNRLKGATGNDFLSAGLIGGSSVNMVGGRGADIFNVAFSAESGPLSLAVIEDFQAAQGDKLQLSFSSPGVSLASADTFAMIDTNLDGRLDDADATVVQWGPDLHVGVTDAAGAITGVTILLGLDHVDTSMLIG